MCAHNCKSYFCKHFYSPAPIMSGPMQFSYILCISGLGANNKHMARHKDRKTLGLKWRRTDKQAAKQKQTGMQTYKHWIFSGSNLSFLLKHQTLAHIWWKKCIIRGMLKHPPITKFPNAFSMFPNTKIMSVLYYALEHNSRYLQNYQWLHW